MSRMSRWLWIIGGAAFAYLLLSARGRRAEAMEMFEGAPRALRDWWRARGHDPAVLGILRWSAVRRRIPLPLMLGIAEQESRFNPQARGPTDDWGLMQVTTATARAYGHTGPPAALLDPWANADIAGRLLADLTLRHGGRLKDVLAAYNTGRPYGATEPGKRYADATAARVAKYEALVA